MRQNFITIFLVLPLPTPSAWQEGSLKSFMDRPGNRELLEEHQVNELKLKMKVDRRYKALELRESVLDCDDYTKRLIAPYLDYPVLRNVLASFNNDKDRSFREWVENPQVMSMLQRSKEMLDAGHITEEELETNLTAVLAQKNNPASENFKLASYQAVKLNTMQLVPALNEHLSLRRAGNEYYQEREFEQAMLLYRKALAVVEFVQGRSPHDQEEIDKNRVTVLLNIAAVELECKNYGHAVEVCAKALELEPENSKGLLRRAKANIRRHEYEDAKKDLALLKKVDPYNFDADKEERFMHKLMREQEEKQKKQFAAVLKSTQPRLAGTQPAVCEATLAAPGAQPAVQSATG
eukprot:jgi/Mesvir1/13899/Mv16025-RA.2